MFVQRVIKGVAGGPSGLDDREAKSLIDDRSGLQCQWWRNVHAITPSEVAEKLTHANLDRHVNHYASHDPATGGPFYEGTPFISTTAGCVERDVVLQTNHVYPARFIALDFATTGGMHEGYLFYAWVIVGLRPAVEIQSISEEVRELNAYRSYSAFQTEGEIVAKVQVPSNQIEFCEKYEVDPTGRVHGPVWTHRNPEYEEPGRVSNLRELF